MAMMGSATASYLRDFEEQGFVRPHCTPARTDAAVCSSRVPVHQCVIPDALPPSLVEAAKELLATHREAHTSSWHGPPVDTSTDARAEITDEERRLIPRAGEVISTRSRDGKGPQGESGRWQCGELLKDDEPTFGPVLDHLLSHPQLMPLVRTLVGDELCLRGFWSMWRMPVADDPAPPAEREEGCAWPPSSGIHWQMWHREQGGTCLPAHPWFIHSLQVKVELDRCDSSSHCVSLVPESLAQKRALRVSNATCA